MVSVGHGSPDSRTGASRRYPIGVLFTMFPFGNHGVLKSQKAMFLPCRWLKVERGTPFLISNAFLHALEADLRTLHIPEREASFPLQQNSKGLFTVSGFDGAS